MDLWRDDQDTISRMFRVRLSFELIHFYMLKQSRRQRGPVSVHHSNQPIPLEYKRKCVVMFFVFDVYEFSTTIRTLVCAPLLPGAFVACQSFQNQFVTISVISDSTATFQYFSSCSTNRTRRARKSSRSSLASRTLRSSTVSVFSFFPSVESKLWIDLNMK